MYALTRSGDTASQNFARELGVHWAGGSDEIPPAPLDAALIFAPVGYSLITVKLHNCLYLKSAVTQVAENILLINRNWTDASVFDGFQLIDVASSEPFAANALLIGKTVIYPSTFPKTKTRLEDQEIQVRTVDASELAKAEGGVTCCSLIFTANKRLC